VNKDGEGLLVSDENKPKRERMPRRPKPPIVPFRADQSAALHISVSHQRLMARIIMAWAKLENALHDLIWTTAGLSEGDGRILTKNVGAKMLIPMARSLAEKHMSRDSLRTLHVALDMADMRREDRDFIAHGMWTTLMPENVPMAASIKPNSPDGTVATETFPEPRMKLILEEIIRAKDEIFAARNAHAASQDESAERHDPDLLHRGINPKRNIGE
jgi:hypothetical protein